MLTWFEFLICTALIVFSGTKLSKYGDILAEKTGLGRTWIGVALMATVTSLPELVTSISSVTLNDLPDIAVGDLVGACVYNIFIFAVLDGLHSNVPISTKARHSHIISASAGTLMAASVAFGLVVQKKDSLMGSIGLYSIFVFIMYFVVMNILFSYEKKQLERFREEKEESLMYEEISLNSALIKYFINALVVVSSALLLPTIGENLAKSTGLGQTFVGSIFIALSTSLPEVVVSFSAVRMGFIDLSVGNLFGSVIFNLFLLSISDVFYTKGPLLSHVNWSHIVPCFSIILMAGIAIMGITYRAERKRLMLAWDSIAIILVYLFNLVVLYKLK